MVRKLVVDSATIRRSGDLRIARMSFNRYDAVGDCRVRQGDGSLRRMLRDKLATREFEAPPHVLNLLTWINLGARNKLTNFPQRAGGADAISDELLEQRWFNRRETRSLDDCELARTLL